MQVRERPEAWTRGAKLVPVLPMRSPDADSTGAGWCVYSRNLEDAPDVEVISGGINHKFEDCAALWRQGHLFHFGFQPGPDELSAAGRAILLNAIHYIARFTEDRPLAWTPCSLETPVPIMPRSAYLEFLQSDEEHSWIAGRLGPEEAARYEQMGEAAYAGRFAEIEGWMGLDEECRLRVDPDLRSWDRRIDDLAMLEHAFAQVGGPDSEEDARARRVLARYLPDAPSDEAPAVLQRWWERHRETVFFSEIGMYRWWLDPLAGQRGLPSRELRGVRRAD